MISKSKKLPLLILSIISHYAAVFRFSFNFVFDVWLIW